MVAGPAERALAAEKQTGVFINEGESVRRVVIALHKSRTFRVERPFATAVVAAPDIADVRPLSDRIIYVQGKKVGTTNVSIFDPEAQLIGILDLEITVDIGSLADKIRASSGGSGIRVSTLQGEVVLSGTAADAVAAERAVTVARGLLPEGGRLVNAMQVAPPQQVMLEVRFLEVNRNAGRHLGVNLFAAGASGLRGLNTGRGVPGPVVGRTLPQDDPTKPPLATPGQLPIFQSVGTLLGATSGPFGTILTNLYQNSSGTTVDALITALETKGLVRRLAEPNLIALSGDAARFLAGGEFPVPVASTTQAGVPTITIEFKKFGVELAFVPTVLSRGMINLRVEPSVSELDPTVGVVINNTTIPGLRRRDARTTVELRDGQSFAIAGLLETRSEKDLEQVPWIGSVPVLGALFRSTAYRQNETDLVIIVTPRLVAPAVPGQRLASPLESRLPGNDVDFFLNGQPEVKKRYDDYVTSGGELKGPYGHMVGPEYGTNQVIIKSSN